MKTTKLLRFGSQGCGPCKLQKPTVEAFAKTGLVPVEILDIDDEDDFEVAAKYGVRMVPTLVAVDKDGNMLDAVVGKFADKPASQMTVDDLTTWIKNIG